jgi:catechol 2,3-dioxygenase-like lactoylglutathione lyase family enzyme
MAAMASGRAFDHVVLAVRDLARTAAIYESLGFTLTPRAAHEDRMGTSNRLAQFKARNFIELLEVDRPEKLARHDFAASPPFFSFGDHNRRAVAQRDGLSTLVFAGDDARADIARFKAAGVPTFAPFDFERRGKLPTGTEVTLAFSLGFAQSPAMPEVAFFVCENRAQEAFWKPEYQGHANGATGIAAVYLASPAPECDAAFVGKMFGGEVSTLPGGGCRVACGPNQELRVLTPQAVSERDPSLKGLEQGSARLAGIALAALSGGGFTPAAYAGGMFIEWV